MLSLTRRPKVLVTVGSLVLVVCLWPLVGVVTGQDGHWLWLVLLTTRRAAASVVAASALAAVVVGIVWWVDERRHAVRARGATAWLADVGPCTSTWAPRWVTLGGLGFVALGFVLVFASGGEDWGEAPWGAPEAVAPVVSLVKLVGGVLLLAAPGTLLGGGFWWVSRHQVRTGDQTGTGRPDPDGAEPAGRTSTEPDGARTSVRHLALTGPRRPTWLVVAGAALVVLGVAAVAASVADGVQGFPGARETVPSDGLLRCCAFVAEGTALTTWSVAASCLLWAGLTVVAVGASWWDTERRAGRPDTPAWLDGLAPDRAAPVSGVFPPTGALPVVGRVESPEPTAPPAPAAPHSPTRTARWLVLVGAATGVVGALLTASLSTERVGTTVYFYDAGPALLGLVFGLPVGLALVVSGGLWWTLLRRDGPALPSETA